MLQNNNQEMKYYRYLSNMEAQLKLEVLEDLSLKNINVYANK